MGVVAPGEKKNEGGGVASGKVIRAGQVSQRGTGRDP